MVSMVTVCKGLQHLAHWRPGGEPWPWPWLIPESWLIGELVTGSQCVCVVGGGSFPEAM